MPNFIVGARLHDYGKGTPDELFGQVSADGFAAVQLAYKKCVPSVKNYADVTDALVAETVAAEKAHHIQVAVLGTYVELAINDESRLCNVADFKSQLAVCKALGAGCIGTETTAMSKQPAGTTRAQAQELLRAIDGVQLLGAQEAPHILNLAVPGVRSQGLINALQERDIYVSAGSACSKGHRSHVLEAMGVDAAWIDGSVRVSLSDETTEDDIRALAEALPGVLTELRGGGRRA